MTMDENKQSAYNLAYMEIARFLKRNKIKGIVFGAEGIILDTKTRLTTMDIDFLLTPADFLKLLLEIRDKKNLELSNNCYLTNIEIEPKGWISFTLCLKKPSHEVFFEFVNLNNIESSCREKISLIIEQKVKTTVINGEDILFLPVEVIFALRLAHSEWQVYILKINANIAELEAAGYQVNWKAFNEIIKDLGLEKRIQRIQME